MPSAVATLALFLVVYNNLVNLLPQALHDLLYVPLNLLIGALLLLWARRHGFSWRELGLSPSSLRPGLRWGLLLGVALPAPLYLALALPEGMRSLIEDPRIEGVAVTGLAYRGLVRIPLGTALFEEVAFRGVLYGVWVRARGFRSAILGSSIAFGLWHVTPSLELLQQREWSHAPLFLAGGVVGTVIATFLGGLLFCWLRWRTGGAYGPALTHWLVNALALTAVFLLGQQ